MRLALCFALVCACSASDPSPKTYDAPLAAKPIVIDGELDDEAWKTTPWTDYFIDIEGDAKPRPRFKTRAKMAWDENYFYIAADMEEPHVWATLTKHDSVIFHDNDFEVFIDPNGDTLEYYEFEINALNTGWDLFLDKPYRHGGKARNEWEIPGLRTAIHIRGTLNNHRDTDQGWSVEIAFPWKALAEYAHKPVPPKPGDEWRVNFSRVEWKHEIVDGQYRKVPNIKEDNWVWSPQGAINMHIPEHWGRVRFILHAPADVFAPEFCAKPAVTIDRSWVEFTRRLPAESPGKQAYVGFLKDRYEYNIARLNTAYALDFSSFTDLTAYDFKTLDTTREAVRADDAEFVTTIREVLLRTCRP